MSVSWIQGGQPGIRPTQRSANPPPTCFNCGITGHFVVDCPESQQRQTPASFQALAATPYQQYPAPQANWPPQPVAPQNQYPSYPPVQQPQYVPQPPVAQQPYVQPQQPYTAQTSNQQYGRPPYQATPPQFTGPPQDGGQGYSVQQNYGPQSVAPYQPAPQNNYSQNMAYGGMSQSPQQSYPAHNPVSQWNASQPSPHQNFQGAPRSNSVAQNSSFRTPSQPPVRPIVQSLPRQQSFDHGSKGAFQPQQNRTPVTPASNHSAVSQHSVQALFQSPAKPESIANSVSSTLNASVESTIVVEVPKDMPGVKVSEDPKEEDEEQEEEGEFGPEDEAEEIFQWDCEHAFEEIIPKETVALAQPLSAGFKSTPVPLVQAWSTSVPSISRYARKDNVVEYVRTIRSSPQWSYLQEDPAFTENDLDGEVIPFDDVPAWTAARHQQMQMSMEETDPGWETSRKRSRDEDGEAYAQEESETSYDIVEIGNEAHPNKRHKQEASDAIQDDIMEEARGTTPGSMIVLQNARGGTPCLMNNLHDTWAPEPGERATSPPDPTEQLLASLGVSGDAKPVQQMELPPYTGTGEDAPSRTASQTPASTRSLQVKPVQQHALPMNQNYPNANGTPSTHDRSMSNATPTNGMYGNQNHVSFNGGNGQNMDGNIQDPPMNTHFSNNYSNNPPNGYPNGLPMNGPSMNGPPMQAPHMTASPMNGPHVNGRPMSGGPLQRHVQVKGTPINGPNMNNGYVAPPVAQYGPPTNVGYGSAPPMQQQPVYQNAPQVSNSFQSNPQYGQPINPAYGTGPPTQGTYAQPGYGPPVNTRYNSGPPNNYPQGPPQEPPQRPPQYGQNPSSGYGPSVNTTQGYNQPGPPTPYVTGPQPNAPYSQPQYGPPVNQAYGNAPVVNQQPAPQYGAPQPQMQPYGNVQQPPNAYGANTQMSPAQYGPPQVPQYQDNGGYQAQQYQNGPAPQYTNGPSTNYPSSTGPPSQMQFNGAPPNNTPQRQDSGYYSAGGSYGDGSGPNGFNGQSGNSSQAQPFQNGHNNQNGMPQHVQQTQNGFNNQNVPPQQMGMPQNGQQAQHRFNNENAPSQQQAEFMQRSSSDNNQNGTEPGPQMMQESAQPTEQLALQDITNGQSGNLTSPNGEGKKNKKNLDSDATLTDLERELLGELEPTPTRRNPQRKAALKKPQPIVEAAYGRRW